MSCPDDCLQPRAKYGDILLVNDLGPLREGSLYVFYPTSDDALRSNPIPTMLLVETGRFVGWSGRELRSSIAATASNISADRAHYDE